ncbi:MAG: bifunctional 2-methylcitrate dehydratase/aconitate hydratase [Alicyclobacillus sp.]|nr:bifunctional 2-methylcitrate dehydratase/aconitate hydratase [Alicyclobacillus sp.]
MESGLTVNQPSVDEVMDEIVTYALDSASPSGAAMETARLAVLDTVGCALAALAYPACTRLLGPPVPGTHVPNGARVPGTTEVVDPVQAAFDFGALLRWLDYNDTWLAAEWGHPSDNLGAILPVADALCRGSLVRPAGTERPRMQDVLDALVRAYEIQGVLSLDNSLNQRGLDHVLFVKIASAAACARLLGANRDQMMSAVSNAFLDNAPLRTYRHAPNTGSRKSWAAADACSRGVRFALLAMRGEPGYARALSAPTWGFEDVVFGGNQLTLSRPLQSYVMEHVLFKVSYPAEFHAQTALEAAILLHPEVGHRWGDVAKIRIETHASAIRIIDKRGPLRNPADRDHCIQYIVAVGLLKGGLTALDYEDAAAADERIDRLRGCTEVVEEPQYSADYLDPQKRSVASAVTVQFADGTATRRVAVEYPLGHPFRRAEALPALRSKFLTNAAGALGHDRAVALADRFWETRDWLGMPVSEWVDEFLPIQ